MNLETEKGWSKIYFGNATFCWEEPAQGGILARRDREREQPIDAALAKVSRLSQTPLEPVSQRLEGFLKQAKRSYESRELDAKSFAAVCIHIARIVDRLPASFGDRFLFDSALIHGIGDDFGEAVALSHMIVPRYESDWGHERVSMPSENRNSAHMMELIHLPGKDRLSEVDLLSYPWIIHELGHYILGRHSERFIPAFTGELKQAAAKLRFGAIADRGQAKARADETLSEVFKFWSPSYDQHNWAHELTIDLMSLWCCGPAYLACFVDVVESSELNPYELTEGHPPYAVRADALLRAAAQLSLGRFGPKLQRVSENWHRSRWKHQRDNKFLALARPELVDASLKVAFALCRDLKIPQCTAQVIADLNKKAAQYNGDEIGIDLLLLAWFLYEEKGQDAFASWEERTVGQLMKAIKS